HQLWISARAAFVFTIIMVAVVTIFRKPLMHVFTNNADVITIGASVLALSILLETVRTMNIVVDSNLRASG
ncbi:MATE family efflux transporter, partial [Lysinibacillus fusiformis]|uniref:MATE family efflux transporter n=1 Tax=Lysinibacillus fusiformis TaxID=28031 RepID=UPI00201C0360